MNKDKYIANNEKVLLNDKDDLIVATTISPKYAKLIAGLLNKWSKGATNE